jgi:hypothetical protein
MSVLGFYVSMVAVKGNELAVGSSDRPLLIFFLDNPTSSKIFFYQYPGALCTPWFLHPSFKL